VHQTLADMEMVPPVELKVVPKFCSGGLRPPLQMLVACAPQDAFVVRCSGIAFVSARARLNGSHVVRDLVHVVLRLQRCARRRNCIGKANSRPKFAENWAAAVPYSTSHS